MLIRLLQWQDFILSHKHTFPHWLKKKNIFFSLYDSSSIWLQPDLSASPTPTQLIWVIKEKWCMMHLYLSELSINLTPQLDFCSWQHGMIWEKQSSPFLLAKHFTGLSNLSPLQDLVASHVAMHRTLLPDGQSCHMLFLCCAFEF